MEFLAKRALFGWPEAPIPGLKLSASGLLALADLKTVAHRTAITGGSSWLDCLLLAPGIHYHQAVDAVEDHLSEFDAVEIQPGKTTIHHITNPATIRFLKRTGKSGDPIVIDVGVRPPREYWPGARRRRPTASQRAAIWDDQKVDLGLLSHILYLASPLLTVAAFVFFAFLEEWWGIALLIALMFSRALNVWVIKQRSRPRPPRTPLPSIPSTPSSPPRSPNTDNPHHHHHHHHHHHSHHFSNQPIPTQELANLLTEYIVDLGHGRSVCLRGLADDLRAVTATPWLASKTHIESYLEATATVIVYIVASFSGNMKQTGQIIFMALLVTNAALLGLSNGHAKTLQMHGRIATPTTERLPRIGWGDGHPPDHRHDDGVSSGSGSSSIGGGGGGDTDDGDSFGGGGKGGYARRRGGGGGGGGGGGKETPMSMASDTPLGASVSWPGTAYTRSRETSFGRESTFAGSSVFDDYAEKGQMGPSAAASVRFPFQN